MKEQVVVVGAGLGGLRAAESLRGAGYDGHIIVIGEEPHLPYNRPPLSKEALAGGVNVEDPSEALGASVHQPAGFPTPRQLY